MTQTDDTRWDGPTLAEAFRQVRALTLRLLDAASDEQLFWVPEGLTNHTMWRMGHCLWVMDDVLIRPATGASELPEGWAGKFEMDGRPPSEIAEWPSRDDVRAALVAQAARVAALLSSADAALLARPHPGWPTLGGYVIHGIHDEALHQGETYFALKMQRVNIGYR
ncbi:MAG: DinB family protein [Planctomycetota bacterium]